MSLRYLSVCSGIEAATVAWHGLGWTPVAFSEIEAFPSAVLRTHYPDVPNWGDMTKFQEWPDACICGELQRNNARGSRASDDDAGLFANAERGRINSRVNQNGVICSECNRTIVNVLVGGTPCQSFSVAGLRKGLADPRGNLALTYLAIADKYRPRWLVWENVPGVLSSAGGRDFGAFVGGLAELGYGWAYRVLDAQYFGVAQRRRRVFVVGCLGGWQRAAAVLFERHSLSGHPAPRRKAWEDITRSTAASLTSSGRGVARSGELRGQDDVVIASTGDVAACLETTSHDYSRADGFTMIAHALRGEGFDASEDGTARRTPVAPVPQPVALQDVTGREKAQNGRGWNDDGSAYTLDAAATQGVALLGGIDYENNAHGADDPTGPLLKESPSGGGRPLPAIAIQGTLIGRQFARVAMQVRRLTPVECERLQGFPDGYTAIPWRGKDAADCSDGPRYKALGNSMAVPVMRWIGARLSAVEAIAADVVVDKPATGPIESARGQV